MELRLERPGDEDAIDRVTTRAFAGNSHTGHAEAEIIRALRTAGDLTLSLVAETCGALVGHAAFSPVAVDGLCDDRYGLGPVSVDPDFQRRGIGSALVQQGLTLLRDRGAKGCAVLGNPDFYRRFGFTSDGALHYGAVPAKYIQFLVFEGEQPSGTLSYAPAFDLAAP